MFENEISKYKSLNRLAEADGIVVFGGSDDINIPLGELKQAFALNCNIYNRSFSGLSVADAIDVYEKCISELCPDAVLVHMGDADIYSFVGKETEFKENYRSLVGKIREKSKNCRIVVVSLKNQNENPAVDELNKLLKEIATLEKCEFTDISAKVNFNIKESCEITSFLYNVGFVSPLNIKRPIYNLVRILFCYEG
jgi:hypothetical protein